jgi:uncharacterized protein (TIGR02145 family)
MFFRVIILFFLVLPFSVYSQGEWNKWYFGLHAGLDFNSGTPVVLTNGSPLFNAYNYSVSMSDSLGNLLFYSDGQIVFNRNHQGMPDGASLSADGWQPVFAFKKPGSRWLYYIFTEDASGPASPGLRYVIIDMKMNGGMGGLQNGWTPLTVPGGELTLDAVTGIRHSNCRDVWIVVRESFGSNRYLSYLVTGAGIDTVPVESFSTITLDPSGNAETDVIRISPDGTHLIAIYDHVYEYCRFNPTTGQITPLFCFHTDGWTGGSNLNGVEFSEDSKYLYLQGPWYGNSGKLIQYDATNIDSVAFLQSATFIGIYQHYSALMMAPDGKIYCTVEFKDSLCVINDPSAFGSACNFVKNAISLQGRSVFYGLPQFLQTYYVNIHASDACNGDTIPFSAAIWPHYDSISWEFGDPASGLNNYSSLENPVHAYDTAGDYYVRLIAHHNDHRYDTGWLVVHVYELPHPDLGPDRVICSGDSVTFDAGSCSSCAYQWVNLSTGMPVGSDPTYTTGMDGYYEVVVTGPGACTGRDTVQLTTTPVPSVTNIPPAKSICSGEATGIALTASIPTATFSWTATLTSGNITGFSAGSGQVLNQVLTNLLPTPGIVTYHITPEVGSCTGAPSDFDVTVVPGDSVNVTISAASNNVCIGTPVTVTATPFNGGTSPSFMWVVNGAAAGTNSPVLTYIPANGDIISCTMTSSETCTVNNPITSNTLSITTNNPPVVTFIPCFDTITTTNAKPIRLKGGIPLGGVYSCGGCTGGFMNPPAVGVGTHIITYAYTNAALCSASAGARIHVFNTAPFTCGSTLTDIRDSKIYPTIQIGSQCWMASNLNYGIPVPSTRYQRDNCIPERYKSGVGSQESGVYQWDEVMTYDDTPGMQGLCPPAWHIPSETDWNTLFSNLGSNGYAGSPLKYDGYSGFNALLVGANHQNRQWDFADFATFFWSSTAHGPYKAWSHGLNEYNHSVSFYPSLRSNAFSARCVQD